jgi:hypothetical protein
MMWKPRVDAAAVAPGHDLCDDAPMHVQIVGIYKSGKICRVVAREPCPRCGTNPGTWLVTTTDLKKPPVAP